MKPNHSDYPVFTSCPLNDWLENRKELDDSNVTKVKENLKEGVDKACPNVLRAEVSKHRRVNSKVRKIVARSRQVAIANDDEEDAAAKLCFNCQG